MHRLVPALVGVAALAACDDHPPATVLHDAGPPIAPLDAAVFARSIPVLEAPPPTAPAPPAFPSDAGTDFEGEIDFTVTMPRLKIPTIKVQLFVKGEQTVTAGKGRGGPLREIFRPKEGAGYEVLDKEKTFERFTLDYRTADMAITRSTVREKIAGGECEDWEIRSSSGHSRACVTRGLGPYLVGKTFTATANWSAVLVPDGYFALRATLLDDDGGTDFQTVTVTRVVRQSVPDDLFTWPSDYRDAAELDQERGR